MRLFIHDNIHIHYLVTEWLCTFVYLILGHFKLELLHIFICFCFNWILCEFLLLSMICRLTFFYVKLVFTSRTKNNRMTQVKVTWFQHFSKIVSFATESSCVQLDLLVHDHLHFGMWFSSTTWRSFTAIYVIHLII